MKTCLYTDKALKSRLEFKQFMCQSINVKYNA